LEGVFVRKYLFVEFSSLFVALLLLVLQLEQVVVVVLDGSVLLLDSLEAVLGAGAVSRFLLFNSVFQVLDERDNVRVFAIADLSDSNFVLQVCDDVVLDLLIGLAGFLSEPGLTGLELSVLGWGRDVRLA